MKTKPEQLRENAVPCGCGRSPTGKCIGWHKLSEEKFQESLLSFNTAAEQMGRKPFVPVKKQGR